MSKIFVSCFVALSMALNVQAEFKLPKSVYRMKKLDEAKADAETKGEAITFIYTDENTSCGKCTAASVNAMDQLGKKTVVVYVDCFKEGALLPSAVQKSLNQPAAGRFIPITVIVDAGMTNVLAIVPYALGQEQNQLLKEAKKKLPDKHPRATLAGKTTPAANPPLPAVPRK